MQNQVLIIIAVAMAFLFTAGCIGNTPSEPPSGSSSVPTPEPTFTLPPGQSVTIQVNEKDPIYDTISVIFSGGEGQMATKDIRVRVTRADGEVIIEHLPAEKGAELIVKGTKDTDRIEVYVTLNTGITYKVIDQLLPHRTRA
ncbi:MAG: hypothetical protein LUQ33_01305 [Methanoregulaceae archaeon]|jgi:ABC-type Fe3+-hydroxamate transport system substrate-binding protein|nr:hypothetical protein [Methanoregulaceae archaeon]